MVYGFQAREDFSSGLLKHDAVYSGVWLPTFWKNLLPPSWLTMLVL
jgi:hypothetical protein